MSSMSREEKIAEARLHYENRAQDRPKQIWIEKLKIWFKTYEPEKYLVD